MRRELLDALEVMAGKAPIALWLEDVHWSDLSTLDWIAAFAARAERTRVVLFATCRTAEVRPARHPLRAMTDTLHVKGLCEEILLTGLTERDIGNLIAVRYPAQIGGLDRLGSLVHRHTGGNPLFVMNVLGDLVARGVLAERGGQWTIAPDVDVASLGIPEDVRRTIVRQIDRLNPTERRLLEAMSVLGSACPAAAVAAGVDLSAIEVEAALGALARERWLIGETRQTEWPDGTKSASFEFLHALYRDVAGGRVHPAQRVDLHRRVGERLERGFAHRVDEIAAELAVHFDEAGDASRAIVYLQRAAETSRRRSAYTTAEKHLRRALALVAYLLPSINRTEYEIDIRIAIGSLLMGMRGWGSDEIETHYARALDLCRVQESTDRLFPSLWGLWLFQWGRGDARTANNLASELRAHARRTENPTWVLQACHACWATSFSLGRLNDARREAAEGTALYRIDQHAPLASAYGNHDAGACALNFAARALVLLGNVDEAARASEAALTLARQLGHPFTIATTLFFASTVHHARQDPDATLTHASAAAALARDHGYRLMEAWASIFKGWALVRTGRHDDGLTLVRDSLSAAAAHSGQFLTHSLGVLADACHECRQYSEGLRAVEEGLRLVDRMGERFYEAELYRLRGELRLGLADADATFHAIEDFRRACAIADGQDARWLLLRATASLARAVPGSATEERRRLNSVMETITEGFELPDMRAAMELQARRRATRE
jgi:predicted ATPase